MRGGAIFTVKLGPGPGFLGGVKVFCYTGLRFAFRLRYRFMYYAGFFHWFRFGLWSHDLNDKDLSLGWISIPRMGTVPIWGRGPKQSLCSGNLFCVMLCSHSVWSPSPNLNPIPVVEINHYTSWYSSFPLIQPSFGKLTQLAQFAKTSHAW